MKRTKNVKSSNVSGSRSRKASLSSFFEHHLDSAIGSIRRLLARPLGSAMTAAVLAVALGLPAAFYWLIGNLQTVGDQYPDARQISLFLPADGDRAAAEALAARLRSREDVQGVDLLDPEEELMILQQRFADPALIEALPANPLPWTVLVTPAARFKDTASVSALAQKLEVLPGVESTLLDMAWLDRLNALLALASRAALVLAVLLSIAALLIVGNTIGLELKTRSVEIEITRLLGATDSFVRRPFLYLGLSYGLLGGVLAALVIVLGVGLLAGPVSELAASYSSDLTLRWPGVLFVAALVLGGGAIGWAGAWLAAGRQLGALDPD